MKVRAVSLKVSYNDGMNFGIRDRKCLAQGPGLGKEHTPPGIPTPGTAATMQRSTSASIITALGNLLFYRNQGSVPESQRHPELAVLSIYPCSASFFHLLYTEKYCPNSVHL